MQILNHPRVTVLMPVYNGEAYLMQAVESILDQSFRDLEFLIIDDGSVDGSVDIIRSYTDRRICLFLNEQNRKIVETLNRGLSLARGQYVARMDCDDISLPSRLAKQVAFLDTHPHIGICGTWIREFNGKKGRVIRYPTEPDLVKSSLLFSDTLAHPSVMMRREAIEKHHLRYEHGYGNAEDFQFWQKASEVTHLANIPEVLLLYRMKPTISKSYAQSTEETLKKIYTASIARLGVFPEPHEISIHRVLSASKSCSTRENILRAEEWLTKLLQANTENPFYPRNAFSKVLAMTWFNACNATTGLGLWVWKRFWQSPLNKFYTPTVKQRAKFLTKCLIRKGVFFAPKIDH